MVTYAWCTASVESEHPEIPRAIATHRASRESIGLQALEEMSRRGQILW
jgi:hypothetical protein